MALGFVTQSTTPRHRRAGRRLGLLATACAALLMVASLPAHAAESPGGGDATPVVGDFAVGDALEALIDERDGSFGVTIPVGGLDLRWDSRAAAAGDRFGFGAGWGYALGFVDTGGGVRYVPPTSGEVFEADASAPSGLHGYTLEDLRFRRVAPDALPARSGGGAERSSVPAFAVHELGGTTTYYGEAGDPVAQITAHGDRRDWHWSPTVPHRLEEIVDVDGVVTVLDWESEDSTVVVRPGANLPAEADGADRAWRVRFDGDGVVDAVTDPMGGRTDFGYRGAELTRIASTTGARTHIDWQRFDDGVPRVRRVSTATDAGRQLSARTWDRFGAAAPSGWPLADGGRASWAPDAQEYRTTLSDGATLIRSVYTGEHLLRARDVRSAAPEGERLLQRQRFEYPSAGAPDAAGRAIGTLRARPIGVEVSRFGPTGASRSEERRYGYDAFGRVTREIADNGSVVETAYDEQVPDGRELPVGLLTRRTVTTIDGLARVEASTLNEARTAVVASETLASGSAAEQLVVTGRTEFTVEPDGFVSERRVFPAGDPAAAPVVTRWSTATELAAGRAETVETVGVGSGGERRTSQTVSLLHGGVLGSQDAFGRVATAEYDLLGRVVSKTDAAGRTVSTAYESWQHDGRNATVVTGPDGVVEAEVRDELGRVVLRTDNIDHGVATEGHVRVVESMAYEVPGTVTVTDAWGATASVSKDVFGRETRRVGPTGLAEVTSYDDVAEQVTTGSTPTGDLADAESVTTRRLDREHRTTRSSVTRVDGATVPETAATVDGLGRPITASDGFVRSAARYDPFGRPATTTFAGERAAGVALVAEQRYDALGNGVEKRLADAAGETSGGSREVDAFGLTRSETDLAGRTTTYEYSLDGLTLRASRSDGRVIVNEYDPGTRELTRSVTTSPIGPPVETAYEYDQVTGNLLAVFDPRDRAGSEIAYTSDAHGNLLTTAYPDGSTVRHGYDLHGRRTTTTDPAGNVTEFRYDPAGVLVGVVQRDPEGAELARTDSEFDELDRLVALTRGNGVVTEYTYTSADELASETTSTHDRALSARTYAYDARGLLVERVDAVTDEQGDERRTSTRYRYDERERLVGSSVHDGDELLTRTTYELSVAGDVTSETVVAEIAGVETVSERHFDYSPVGELVAYTADAARLEQRYDAAGNLVRAADGTTYAYNAAGRPVSETAPDGTVIATEYWADGTRRRLSTIGVDGVARSTDFAWDGSELIAETHRVGETVTRASYLLGAGRHARVTSDAGRSGTTYYGTDRHGNVTELTASDGRVVERYAYADYGAEVARGGGTASPAPACEVAQLGDPARNPFRYAGEYTDPTCRQHLAVRSYDSGTMRFTSMDTAAVMNPYAYTDGNPITRVDPTGNFFSPDDANGTYFAIAMSALGLLTTAYAVLFPVAALSPLASFALGVGALGDLAALVTSSIRADDPGWLDDETDSALSQVDVLSGFVLVGVIAAAQNVWKRVRAWRASRLTERSRLISSEQPRSIVLDGGHGGGGGGATRRLSQHDDEFTEITLTPNSSRESSPVLSPVPSPRSNSWTFVIPDGRKVTKGGGRHRSGGIALDVPAATVSTPGNIQESSRLTLSEVSSPWGFSSKSARPSARSGADLLDSTSTATTRWPSGGTVGSHIDTSVN